MQALHTSDASKKKFREASGQCDSTRGDSISDRTLRIESVSGPKWGKVEN